MVCHVSARVVRAAARSTTATRVLRECLGFMGWRKRNGFGLFVCHLHKEENVVGDYRKVEEF
jgi:hypothetical protein